MEHVRGTRDEETAMLSDYDHSASDEGDISHPATLQAADSIGQDEAFRLKDLATGVRDQDDLERDISRQADQLLTSQANERDQKRLEKTVAEKEYVGCPVRLFTDLTPMGTEKRRTNSIGTKSAEVISRALTPGYKWMTKLQSLRLLSIP